MHLDVNTQMNYWPAEVTNLGECTRPLFAWIEGTLVPSGRHTAKETYGCRGWVVHTVSNAWGYSAPGWSSSWGLHPTAGAWIASHMWEHYRFGGDEAFVPVGSLSFGERARLALARLVAQGCNFLLLDEPINHLDIPSRSRFEQAMTAFEGTVLAIVHDRYFIERFATGLWAIEGGTMATYPDLDEMRRVRQQG